MGGYDPPAYGPPGGLYHFPRAESLASLTEFRDANGTIGKLRGYLPHRLPQWFAPTLVDYNPKPFGPFPTSFALTRAQDVVIVPTPGHTNGHQSVILRDGDHYVFLADDRPVDVEGQNPSTPP